MQSRGKTAGAEDFQSIIVDAQLTCLMSSTKKERCNMQSRGKAAGAEDERGTASLTRLGSQRGTEHNIVQKWITLVSTSQHSWAQRCRMPRTGRMPAQSILMASKVSKRWLTAWSCWPPWRATLPSRSSCSRPTKCRERSTTSSWTWLFPISSRSYSSIQDWSPKSTWAVSVGWSGERSVWLCVSWTFSWWMSRRQFPFRVWCSSPLTASTPSCFHCGHRCSRPRSVASSSRVHGWLPWACIFPICWGFTLWSGAA